MMPGMPILYGLTDLTDLRITMVKQKGDPASPIIKHHQTSNPRQSAPFICVYLREPHDPGSSPWGGKVRLPQRPEVSSKQATPLPLPNRLRQPIDYLREPLDPGSSLLRIFPPVFIHDKSSQPNAVKPVREIVPRPASCL